METYGVTTGLGADIQLRYGVMMYMHCRKDIHDQLASSVTPISSLVLFRVTCRPKEGFESKAGKVVWTTSTG